MKNLVTVFMCLLALGSAAMADRVVIYSGRQLAVDKAQTLAKEGVSIEHSFYLFDLDTQEYTSVAYSDVRGARTYAVGGTTAFTNAPIETATNAGYETNFAFGGITSSSSFEYRLGIFHGADTQMTFSSTFSGEVARVLSFSGVLLEGSGTLSTDSDLTITGLFGLDEALTKASNVANNNLSGATQVVTSYLSSLHYSAAP